MGQKRRRIYSPLFTALLTQVPTNWPLSYITQALCIRFPSLIAIYRVCEYPEGKNTDRIFISVYNEDDYLKLQEFKSLIIRRQEIPIIFNDWRLASALFPKNFTLASRREIEEIPISLSIPGIKKLSHRVGEYLNDIIIALEEIGGTDLIGLKLINGRKCLRPFGFASYKNRHAMLRQLYKCIDIKGDIVMCEDASSVPFVIHKNCKLINNCKTLWTKEINCYNWLTITTEVIPSSDDELLVLDSDHEFDDWMNIVVKKRRYD